MGQRDMNISIDGTLGRNRHPHQLPRQPDGSIEREPHQSKAPLHFDGDEHTIIANYAARLAALKTLTGQYGVSYHLFIGSERKRITIQKILL